ncbi:MAG TPA: sugar ABC transporter ATP-binding protein [Solirubrobacteraceae bacterium]|nr:sugar ABC transporter ATP-binding protein [Solirubrobacteraceae bacterium]
MGPALTVTQVEAPAAGAALRLRGVSKAFAGVPALIDASLDVRPGKVHCLVGANGSGKSTLIKILAGVYQADQGTLSVGGRTIAAGAITPGWARDEGLSFVHQDLAIFPTMTVAENFAIGTSYPTVAGVKIRWSEVNARCEEAFEKFHIRAPLDAPLAAISAAQRTMIAIARAHQAQGEDAGAPVLILDEPTASLPPSEAQFVLDMARRCADDGGAVLFVGHRLDEILFVADDVTVLRDGRVVRSGPLGGMTKADLVEQIVGRELEQPPVPQAAATDATEPVLTVSGLAGGPLHDVALEVRPGEVVGIAGLVGSGRSRLLKAIAGVVPQRAGSVHVAGSEIARGDILAAIRAGVAYLPENRDADAIFGQLDVRENLSATDVGRFWRGLRLRHSEEAADAQQSIADFLIRTSSDRQPIMTLSGGNRQKVVIARLMRTAPKLLLLDEPTQGVDVGARHELHRLIRAAADGGAGVLLASSDLEELATNCDRVLVLASGGIVAELRQPEIDASRLARLSFPHDLEPT